jgi:hypothetical protein
MLRLVLCMGCGCRFAQTSHLTCRSSIPRTLSSPTTKHDRLAVTKACVFCPQTCMLGMVDVAVRMRFA